MSEDPYEDPDGWIIVHYRALGGGLIFGPFPTLEEAKLWSRRNPSVQGGVYPMHLTVDWSRKGVI